jgi:hypothetical protein
MTEVLASHRAAPCHSPDSASWTCMRPMPSLAPRHFHRQLVDEQKRHAGFQVV